MSSDLHLTDGHSSVKEEEKIGGEREEKGMKR